MAAWLVVVVLLVLVAFAEGIMSCIETIRQGRQTTSDTTSERWGLTSGGSTRHSGGPNGDEEAR
jgi:hypothetical protein